MPVVDELVAILGYRLEGQQNLKKFQGGLDGAEKQAKGTAGRLNALALRYGGMLGGVFTGAAAAAGAAEAVKRYAALERQMTRVGLAAGATDAETKTATRSVAQMATELALPLDQAYAGLDALVATGKSMPEALAFLPSILKTAQASGAATDDMAASANALATSFKLAAPEMQSAFDMLVTGGQLGQFELKDMAQALPSLTASAQKLGFTGLDGTKRLVAMLQTVRQVSGTSGEAATAVGDAFEKTLSPTVAQAFKKRGINIGKVLEGAAKKGVNQFEAVIDVLRRTTAGMSETERNMFISSIYTDKEARRAVTALIQLGDAYQEYQKNVANSAGATDRNLRRVLDDTQARVDRLANSFGNLTTQVGAALSGPLVPLMDAVSGAIDREIQEQDKLQAVYRALQKEGMSALQAILWVENPIRTKEEFDAKAREGGFAGTAAEREAQSKAPYAYEKLGRFPNRPTTPTPEQLPPRGGKRRTLENAPDINSRIPNAYDEGWRMQMERNQNLLPGGRNWVPAPPPTGSGGDEPLLPANATPLSGSGNDVMAKIQAALDGAAGVTADITNNYNISVSAPTTITVQQATQAPGALQGAIQGAVEAGANAGAPARMRQGPVQ